MATFYLALYPVGITPTWSIGAGWSGTPVYTDADTDPGTGSTYQFVPDASGLTAGTQYVPWAVHYDGTTTVGPAQGATFETLAATANLTPQDASHTHTTDNPTLSVGLSLAVQDALHAHAADNLTTTTGLSLAVQDALHNHTADAAVLVATLTLAVQSASHAHTTDAATLSAALTLAVQDALHAHAADAPTLASDGTGSDDPYWDNVVSLLHFDGADNSTTFTDEKPWTWTPSGNAHIETTQSKFGGASGYFDGEGDYLSVPTTFAAEINNSVLTIEAWVWIPPSFVIPAGNSDVYNLPLLGQTASGPGGEQYVGLLPTGALRVDTRNGIANVGFVYDSAAGAVSANTWHHVAFVYAADRIYGFVDGEKVIDVASARKWVNNGNAITVGRQYNPSYSQYKGYFNGYIDDFRVTKGVARYTEAFTPPTAPFPNAGTSGATLFVADATHTHLADALVLTGSHSLTVQDSLHSHTVEALSISAALNLLVDNALHAQLADNVALSDSTAANLVAQNATHSHLSDALTLSGALALIVQDAQHAHLSEQATLSAAHSLVVQNAAHAHLADVVDASSGLALSIANAFHTHLADNVDADTALSLAIHDALHAHQAEAATLTAALTLIVSDAIHAHFADQAEFFIPVPLVDQLRRSVFLRIAQQRPFVRVDEQRIFIRVQ